MFYIFAPSIRILTPSLTSLHTNEKFGLTSVVIYKTKNKSLG